MKEGDKGLDGRGANMPREKTPQASVDVTSRSDAPGSESKSGKGNEMTGPNPGGSGKK